MALLTVADVSELLKISARRVHCLCRSGQLSYVDVGRKDRRFTPAMLDDYIVAQTISQNQSPKVDTVCGHRLPSRVEKGGSVRKTEEMGKSLRKEMRSLCR